MVNFCNFNNACTIRATTLFVNVLMHVVGSFTGYNLITRMMKSAGCTLIPSFNPIHSITLKNHRRSSLNQSYGNSAKSKKLIACIRRHRLHTKVEMVAGQYLPPWFRLVLKVSIYIAQSIILNDSVDLNYVFLIFSVAPMMDWTNNHYRTLARLISKNAWLYTEMIAAETIVYQEKNLVSCWMICIYILLDP